MEIAYFNNQEMFNILFNKETISPVLPEKDNHIFEKWKYFSSNDFDMNDRYYIVAYKQNLIAENIIAVLKYGIYMRGHHIGFSYIDVKEGYKHQGLETKLVELFADLDFSKYNVEDKRIYISFFSDECLEKHFNKKVKEIFKNLDVIYRT